MSMSPARIALKADDGGIGFSVGGEMMIEAAAESSALRARLPRRESSGREPARLLPDRRRPAWRGLRLADEPARTA